MEKSIYKTIFLKLKTNNDKRFIKKISLRINKKININNEFLNNKIQNKVDKNEYNNEDLEQNDLKNKINQNNKLSDNNHIMNNSFFSNKKIIFYNTLINQRLKNEQNWNVMKVHNYNISLDLEQIKNEKINNGQILSLKKKNYSLIKNNSVINNYNYNKQLYRTFYLKNDSTNILKEYANERLSKNPLIKKILFKRFNKEMNKKKNSILFQSIENNLSSSIRDDNKKSLNEYYQMKKNEFPILNIDSKMNLKKNHRKINLIKKKNNSVEYIQKYNLKIKY